MKYVAPAIMTLGRISIKTEGCECIGSDDDGLKLPPPLFD